jgi:hypothetical protein
VEVCSDYHVVFRPLTQFEVGANATSFGRAAQHNTSSRPFDAVREEDHLRQLVSLVSILRPADIARYTRENRNLDGVEFPLV